MPRQTHKIVRFEGGVNSATDPRDIQDAESLELTSVYVDNVGRIKMAGNAILDENIPAVDNGGDNSMKSGCGFFIFSHDYNMLKAANDIQDIREPDLANTEFFVYQDDQHTCITQLGGTEEYNIDAAGHTNANGVGTFLDGGASFAGSVFPDFYFADKAMRVSDIGFNNTYKARWIGHIKRNLLGEDSPTGTTTQNINFWHSTTTRLMPPSSSDYVETVGAEKPGIAAYQHGGTTAVTDKAFKIHTTDTTGDGGGTWIDKNYAFYLSYIYDGSQESPVYELDDSTAIADDSRLLVGVSIDYYSGSAYRFNPRITGGRVYYSDPGDGLGIKYHLLDIDFTKGCRKFDETEWTAWVELGSGNEDYNCPSFIGSTQSSSNSFVFEHMPKTVTYEMLNSYGSDEVTHAEYKCSTIFNNRCYIGNIRQARKVDDAYNSNLTPTYNDRIIRSPINFEGNPQYDTFPATHKMDVAANDGDDVTALKGFGDRLLIFKKKSVYVVNVAQDGAEFVEDKIHGIGVLNATQVVETEYGVAWIRSSGCYLFSGQGKPIDLTEGKLSVSPNAHSKRSKWTIDENKNPSIMYLPNEKKLLISLGLIGDYSSDGWIYDFVSKSWTLLGGRLGDSTKARSNMALSASGKIFFSQYLGSSSIGTYYWDDNEQATSSTAGELRILTKDLDFGHPGVKKNIYKVYVNFRTRTGLSQATNLLCTYQTNGNSGYSGTWSNTASSGVIDAGSSVYKELTETTDTGTNVTGLAGCSNITFDGSNSSSGSTGVFTDHPTSGNAASATDLGSNPNIFKAKINNEALLIESKGSSNNDGIMYDELSLTAGVYYELAFQYTSFPGMAGPVTGRAMLSYNAGNDPLGSLAYFRESANIIASEVVNGFGQAKLSFLVPGSGSTTVYLGFDLNGHTGPITNTISTGWGSGITLTTPNKMFFRNISIFKTSNWSTAELVPLSAIRNAYSFGLQFINDGVVSKDFEIGDISIVYRNKGQR